MQTPDFQNLLQSVKHAYKLSLDAGVTHEELDGQYRELAEFMERQRIRARVEQGKRDVEEGRGRPAEEVLPELRAKYGI